MSVIDILSLVALLWIIQFYLGGENQSFIPSWMPERSSLWPIGIFVILFAIKNTVGFFISRVGHSFISNVALRISVLNLKNYQQAPFEEFINVDSSVHIRKIAFQPYEFGQYILTGFQQIITQGSLILFTIMAILVFNAKLFLLLLLILLPPALLVFYLIKKQSENNRIGIQSSNESSFRYLLDALKGYVEGNVYGRNSFFRQRFLQQRRLFSTYLFNSISLQSLPGRFIEVFAVLGLFLLILIAKLNADAGSSPLVLVGAFVAAAYKIIPGMVRIINAMGQIKAYQMSLHKLVETTNQEILTPVAEEIHTIQLKDIDFKYGHLHVLKRFNLCIRGTDFVGITGNSGLGKTTVLNLLLGFVPALSGRIIINDKEVDFDGLKRYRTQISYVRQQPFFIHDSILRNITLQDGEHDEEKLQLVVKVTGLDRLLENYSEGVEKMITENGKNISGGQQQRIALARALYHDAEVYLLDEPFNELDEESERVLLTHFQKLSAQGKIVVMITHNKEALAFCNKIVSLNG